MKVIGVNHAQVNVSKSQLEKAREFYLGFLGMKEIARPPVFKSEGFWFHAGEFALGDQVLDGLHRQVRIDRRRAETDQQSQMMNLAGVA